MFCAATPRNEFAKPDRIRPVQSGQDQTCSVQACWHVGMLACRHVGQDQTRSGFPKFVTENGLLRVDFPSRIWEIWTGSDTIRVSQIRGGKWLAEGGWPPSSNFYHLKMYLHLVLPNVSCLISEFCVVNKGEYRPRMAELI